jgi:hypothetical protein
MKKLKAWASERIEDITGVAIALCIFAVWAAVIVVLWR